jgi:hypothetical protein
MKRPVYIQYIMKRPVYIQYIMKRPVCKVGRYVHIGQIDPSGVQVGRGRLRQQSNPGLCYL